MFLCGPVPFHPAPLHSLVSHQHMDPRQRALRKVKAFSVLLLLATANMVKTQPFFTAEQDRLMRGKRRNAENLENK